MSLVWTALEKPLGVEAMLAGSTPGLQIDQEAIEGLEIIFRFTGPDAPTLVESLAAIERVIVAVTGTDYVNISGRSLYHFNQALREGAPPYTVVNNKTRHLVLYLPFSLAGGVHSSDTILDLRRSSRGLKQSFVRFQLATVGGAITEANSDVSVIQHYYTLGTHVRKVAFTRQLRERTFAGAANQKSTIQMDHGSDFDDLAGLMIVGYKADGSLITSPLKEITLTASENGTREIFHKVDPIVNYVTSSKLRGRPMAAGNYDRSVFYYDFLRGDLRGHARTMAGLLDASSFSNLLLECTPAEAGTYYVLLDRVNAMQSEPGVESGT